MALKITCWLLVFFCSTLLADEGAIKVVGLFKNAAMVDFNGKQKFYKAGQKISADIQLLKADTHSATFLIKGEQVELGLERMVGLLPPAANNRSTAGNQQKTAKVLRNNRGMFLTSGFINGRVVKFLVDTGASQIAMNERVAQMVGLSSYKLEGEKVPVSTAAGVVPAWRTYLRKVRVGDIELSNVEALVVKGAGPEEVLLGMSFLNRVKKENRGQLMILTKKY